MAGTADRKRDRSPERVAAFLRRGNNPRAGAVDWLRIHSFAPPRPRLTSDHELFRDVTADEWAACRQTLQQVIGDLMSLIDEQERLPAL